MQAYETKAFNQLRPNTNFEHFLLCFRDDNLQTEHKVDINRDEWTKWHALLDL
jgi:hypothetical protein